MNRPTPITPTRPPARGNDGPVPAITAALLSGAARSLLLSLAALLVWAALPAAWGWVPTTVMSDSMAPLIRTGDVVISMPIDADELTPGRDVLVKDPDHPGRGRLHRFVRFAEDGSIVTKGDANPTEDSSHVAADDLVGIAVIRVPYIGTPIVWMSEGRLVPLALGAGAVLALLILTRMGSAKAATPSREGGRRVARPMGRLGRRPTAMALGLTTVTLAAGAGMIVTVAAPAHAAFSAASPSSTSSLGAASAYDCLSPATPDSPFLYYRFSEVSGSTATDSSANARTGTLQGSVTRTAGNCTPGGSPSISMSGTTALVSTPTSVTSPNSVTVETWFTTTSSTGGRLIGFGNSQTGTSTNTDRHIYLSAAGKVLFGAAPGGTRTSITSSASYNDGAWHLASATLGSTGMRLYVDGTLVASNTGVTTGRAATGFWRVGGDTMTGWTSAPSTPVLTGAIGSAAVYTSVLTQARIQSHYASGQ